MIVLLDTNIVIGFLNGRLDPSVLLKSREGRVSVVTVMELYALPGLGDDELKVIGDVLDVYPPVPLIASTAKRAGELARTYKRGRADLLIAATALEYSIELMTLNMKDFKSIRGIKLIGV